MSTGKVAAIRGVVLDVEFQSGEMPEILEALEIEREGMPPLVLEVQQHLSDTLVRTVAMDATDGLRRNVAVKATGSPITVPVGDATLGRIFNVVGEAIDGKPTPTSDTYYPIHRDPPPFQEQATETRTFETGHEGHRPARPLYPGW